MIQALIFDIGGVVYKTDFDSIYANFAKEVGVPAAFVRKYHEENRVRLLLGEMTIEGFWNDVRAAGGADADYGRIWVEAGIAATRPNVELLDWIDRARRTMTVGALTNLTESRLVLDRAMGIYSHFDFAVLSCEEQLMKPDPQFFFKALDKAEARPAEAVFIDDKAVHVEAAEMLGIGSVLYSFPDNAALFEALGELGVPV